MRVVAWMTWLARIKDVARLLVMSGVLLALAIVGVQCRGRRPVYSGPVRHVMFISLDTARADHFGCYGNDWIRTPRIDALASKSLLFENYVTVVPTTLASHTSLFTGKYPHSHGVPRNGFKVHPKNVMLAEILQEAGFVTAGFIASFVLDSRFDFAQGFDFYDERFDQLTTLMGDYQEQRSAEAVTDAVVEYLNRSGVPENLFLFVHYFDPHVPYEPPPPYDTLYDPQGREDLPAMESVIKSCLEQPGQENPAAGRMARQYAGEISYMDAQVGRLLDELNSRGILDEALVVLTSDHGENLWDHPNYFDHGTTTYESTMRAACLIRLPAAARGGTRVEDLVASTDILPTVLDYLGLPIPKDIDGEAVDLAAGGKAASERVRFGEASKPWKEDWMPPRWYNGGKARCVWQGNLKYIQVPYAGTEALYDLTADPLERHNLLPEAEVELLARMHAMRKALAAWSESARPLPSEFSGEQYEETVRKLQALGYLQP